LPKTKKIPLSTCRRDFHISTKSSFSIPKHLTWNCLQLY
jgi:hypothetical protein